MEQEHSALGHRTLRGLFWAYGSYVGGRALVLVSTALLARILTPEDFGLVALALVFMGFLDVVSDLGLTQALVRISSDEDVRNRGDSVWVSSVLIGLASTVVVAGLGPPVASFYGHRELITLMPLLGLNLLVRSLGSTHYAMAQRDLDFRTRTKAELADVLVRGGVGIALAVAGAGAMSLVLGYLMGTIAMTAALWRLVPWRPRLRLARDDLRGLIGFGGAVTAVSVLGAVMGSADDLIVGRVLGAAELGFYSLAYRLPELLVVNLSLVAGQVLFPAMASLSPEAVPAAFLRSLRYGLMIGLALTVLLGFLAEPFLITIFGEKWRHAAPAMQVMSVWTLMSPIGITIGTAYKALGRADILLKLAVPQAVLLVGGVLVVAHRGIVAVSLVQAAIAIAFTAIAMVVAARILSLRLAAVFRTVWPLFAAAAGMAVAIAVVDRLIVNQLVTLLVGGAVGLLVYVALLWLMAGEALRYLLDAALGGRGTATKNGGSNE